MKVVVLFGYILGIALPVLETVRRGFAHWLVNSTTMADDYIMGALLLADRTDCLVVASISLSRDLRPAQSARA